MRKSGKASRKARLFVLCALLAACSKHDEQYVTPWLRVDVVRPRADDLIRIGSREQRWDVKVGSRWHRLGAGNGSGYVILGEEALTATAALVSVNSGTFLVRPDAPPLPLSGALSTPNGMSVDVMQNSDREAHIERYDNTGTRIATFSVSIPAEFSDFRIGGMKGYDHDQVPYVSTFGKAGSPQARCLLIGARSPQVVYAIKPEEPAAQCDFPQLRLSPGSLTYRIFQ